MNKLTTLINDVYGGIYYYSVSHELEETARAGLKIRLWAVFFPYYLGLLIVAIGVRVRVYGPFVPTLWEALIIPFGLYFGFYKWLIEAHVSNASFDDLPEARRRKQKTYFVTLAGGLLCLFGGFIIVWFLYRK